MIRFPTTPEAFIADQERLVGRALSEKEKGVTVAWVEAFNFSYEDGLKQDRAILEIDLDKLDELMARHEDNAGGHKFAEGFRAWMIEAWKQGAEKEAAR